MTLSAALAYRRSCEGVRTRCTHRRRRSTSMGTARTAITLARMPSRRSMSFPSVFRQQVLPPGRSGRALWSVDPRGVPLRLHRLLDAGPLARGRVCHGPHPLGYGDMPTPFGCRVLAAGTVRGRWGPRGLLCGRARGRDHEAGRSGRPRSRRGARTRPRTARPDRRGRGRRGQPGGPAAARRPLPAARRARPPGRGSRCPGTVVGARATGWAPTTSRSGDRVAALLAGGGYAERVVVPAALALRGPRRRVDGRRRRAARGARHRLVEPARGPPLARRDAAGARRLGRRRVRWPSSSRTRSAPACSRRPAARSARARVRDARRRRGARPPRARPRRPRARRDRRPRGRRRPRRARRGRRWRTTSRCSPTTAGSSSSGCSRAAAASSTCPCCMAKRASSPRHDAARRARSTRRSRSWTASGGTCGRSSPTAPCGPSCTPGSPFDAGRRRPPPPGDRRGLRQGPPAALSGTDVAAGLSPSEARGSAGAITGVSGRRGISVAWTAW